MVHPNEEFCWALIPLWCTHLVSLLFVFFLGGVGCFSLSNAVHPHEEFCWALILLWCTHVRVINEYHACVLRSIHFRGVIFTSWPFYYFLFSSLRCATSPIYAVRPLGGFSRPNFEMSALPSLDLHHTRGSDLLLIDWPTTRTHWL